LSKFHLGRVAGGLVVAIAIVLPWSTAASNVLGVLWLIALLPTLSLEAVRKELAAPAGALPVILWLFAAAGMLWADASWNDRLAGLKVYHKLLLIPLVLAQFRNSPWGKRVLTAYLASCSVLLVVSITFAVWPAAAWHWSKGPGVPVKGALELSDQFALCAFGVLPLALVALRDRRFFAGTLLLAGAGAFALDSLYIGPEATAITMAAMLLLLLGFWQNGLRGALGIAVVAVIAALILYAIGGHARLWIDNLANSTAGFVDKVPIGGGGTLPVPELFRRAGITLAPSNQVLAVASQLGLVGTALLVAMWGAHLVRFRGYDLAAWVGFAVVAQNIVGAPFDSLLFEFTQGWTYVFGVSVLGAMTLYDATLPKTAVRRTWAIATA
jgi:O-antigen ligase